LQTRAERTSYFIHRQPRPAKKSIGKILL